jgi:hypothetical protein
LFASRRAIESLAPPAENGTIKVIDLSGYSARAFGAPSVKYSTSPIARRDFRMITFPECFSTMAGSIWHYELDARPDDGVSFGELYQVASLHILRRVF